VSLEKKLAAALSRADAKLAEQIAAQRAAVLRNALARSAEDRLRELGGGPCEGTVHFVIETDKDGEIEVREVDIQISAGV